LGIYPWLNLAFSKFPGQKINEGFPQEVKGLKLLFFLKRYRFHYS